MNKTKENTGNPQEQDFYYWFKKRVDYTKVKHSYYAWRNMDQAYRKMKMFRLNLRLDEVNYMLLKDFEVHLLRSGLSVNTVGEHMVRVRVVVKELFEDEKIYPNPFNRFSIDFTRVKKARIPIEDIRLFQEFPLSGKEGEARDMYILSFYGMGIRFGDLCRLKKAWIVSGHLEYIMHKSIKTKRPKRRRIKLMPAALRICFKYPGEYVFNTGVKWSFDKTAEDKSIGSRNADYNKYLKHACRKAGIMDLSFHTSRNSFADFVKKKKLDIHTLKELFGHSKVSTTEGYMNDFYEEESDEIVDFLFG